MSGDIFELDQGDRETLRGTLHDPGATTGDVLTVQADGSVAAAAIAIPTAFVPQWAQYQGDPVSVPGNGNAYMTWDTFNAGSSGDFLNRFVLDAPTFVAEGLYAITVIGALPGTTLQSFSSYSLSTDRFGGFARGGGLDPMDGATLTAVVPAKAGDTVRVQATNEDTGTAHNMSINSVLMVRISDLYP